MTRHKSYRQDNYGKTQWKRDFERLLARLIAVRWKHLQGDRAKTKSIVQGVYKMQ